MAYSTTSITTKKGFVILVDASDYDKVTRRINAKRKTKCGLRRWTVYVNKAGNRYAKSSVHLEGKSTSIFMHRLILDVVNPKMQVDHINGDGLDNRRCNLRLCTPSQNRRNSAKVKHNTSSKYKGVHFSNQRKRIKRWVAATQVLGKKITIGSFLTEREAAIAYNKATKHLFGEFARLNSI